MARDHHATTGTSMTPLEIVGSADQGNVQSTQTLKRYEDRMARALANVVNILDPDVIVLGGGLSKIDRLYSTVPKLWTQLTPGVSIDHGSEWILRTILSLLAASGPRERSGDGLRGYDERPLIPAIASSSNDRATEQP